MTPAIRRPPLAIRLRMDLRRWKGRHLSDRRRWVFGWLRPGDVAVDCGANVGVVTAIMRERGAMVHAFEPDPAAFRVLRERFGGDGGVVLHNKAVGAAPGTARLFFREGWADDPVAASLGSSLHEAKCGLDLGASVEVEVIDLAAFLRDLGPVAILKVDIEGHEVEAVPPLIAGGLAGRIGLGLIETHETKSPHLAEPTRAMIALAKQQGARHFYFNWH